MSDTNKSATLPPNAHELLAAEISTYERELARLVADGQEGRWVVIRTDQLIGIWDTFDDAIQAGYERLPPNPFLVRQIRAKTPVVRIPLQRTSCPSVRPDFSSAHPGSSTYRV